MKKYSLCLEVIVGEDIRLLTRIINAESPEAARSIAWSQIDELLRVQTGSNPILPEDIEVVEVDPVIDEFLLEEMLYADRDLEIQKINKERAKVSNKIVDN